MRTTLLLPVEMHAALNDVARKERRSVHSQILHWIGEALGREQADWDAGSRASLALKGRVEAVLSNVEGLKPATPGRQSFDGYTVTETMSGHVVVRSGPAIMGGFVQGPDGLRFVVTEDIRRAREALSEVGFDTIIMKDPYGLFIAVSDPEKIVS